MKAYWAAFDTTLKPTVLAARRRRLAELLRRHGVELVSVRTDGDASSAVARLVKEAHGAPVIAVDDGQTLPGKAAWLKKLTDSARDLLPAKRPQLIYVSASITSAGFAQAQRHPLLRKCIKRDAKTRWVDSAAEAVAGLVEQLKASASSVLAPAATAVPEIVGVSACFCDAVENLAQIMRSPYGLVTGDPGVGKLFLIRALWRQMSKDARVIVLPCGSFFKDYYIAGSLRQFGGGREAVDQLRPILEKAQDGLLILHHVEELPTALQEELVARLSSCAGDPDFPSRLAGVDADGLQENDVKIIATSDSSPERLALAGRLIPDLGRKLFERHVRIPSLAERGAEDIHLLCQDLLRRIVLRQSREPGGKAVGSPVVPRMDDNAVRVLAKRFWRYNVSDLQRVLEHAVRKCPGAVIRLAHLPRDVATGLLPGRAGTLDEITAQAQRAAIQNALEQTGGSVSKAATLLGKNRGTLHRLMVKLGMRPDRLGHTRIV